jgi:hypothetical protein
LSWEVRTISTFIIGSFAWSPTGGKRGYARRWRTVVRISDSASPTAMR